jgi:uncharacterized protein YndB with AHSA1/START domain
MTKTFFLMTAMAAAAVAQTSFVTEGTIHAPVTKVWQVWTTGEGYKALGPAQADVDFRIGGMIRSKYATGGTLGDEETVVNRILAYEPERMIALRIERPPKSFPFREAWKNMWTVITFRDLGNGETWLRVASLGFGADEESVKMRKFFEAGNAATLKTLQTRLAK